MDRSVSLTLTTEDYLAANRLHTLKCLRSRVALVNFSLLVVAYVVWMTIAYFDRWGTIAVIVVNACFAAVVVLLVADYYLMAPIRTRRIYRKHKALHRPYTFSWSENGLTITGTSGEWQVAWSDYLKWAENAQVFILYQAPRLFNIVPKRALAPEQIADLRQCAARIPA